MSAISTIAGGAPVLPQKKSRLFAQLKNLVLGTLFCLTPITAILVLGWMMRRMQVVSYGAITSNPALRDLPTPRAGSVLWIADTQNSGIVSRLFGGFWLNLKTGLAGFISLLLATLPFTGLWLFSWWAGWENSFNKGYEQAFVGPLIGFSGVLIGLVIMTYLPMALAHQATTGRRLAVFELAKVRKLVAHSGWQYVLLAAVTVLLALPLFAARGVPIFIEGILPGFSSYSPQEIKNVAALISVLSAAYVFASLVFLRLWSARIYANAVNSLSSDEQQNKPVKLFHWLRLSIMLVIWFALVAQIYAAQFLNLNWWVWLNHPYLLLPVAL